jgi:hypothetical protein
MASSLASAVSKLSLAVLSESTPPMWAGVRGFQ